MRARTVAVVVGLTLAGSLVVLLFTEGGGRAWWFRGYVALIGALALRGLVQWRDSQPRPAPVPAFHRPRWSWRRHDKPAPMRASARLIQLATFSAGDAHRGLRPVLREIADERLRAHHGLTVDDPAASTVLAPATWELLRPDRPAPHDLRAAGLPAADIDAVLDDLERL